MSMVFCRGCGKEIHESAPLCPQCGAPQGAVSKQEQAPFSTYDQVPWYRKNWFAITCFFIFPLGLWIAVLSGDIYYPSKGQIKTYTTGAKITILIFSVIYIYSVIHAQK